MPQSRHAASLLSTVACISIAATTNASPSLNLTQSFADTKAKLSAGGEANIVVIGDSLSVRPGTYLPYLTQHLQSAYGNAGAGYQGFSLWSGGGFNAGWENGLINQDTAPHHSLDGLWASSAAAPFPPTHTSGRFDSYSSNIELQYVAEPGGGSFQIFSDAGQLVQTIDTDAPQKEVRVWNHAMPVGQNRLWYQPQGDGRITILGQNNVSGTPGVRVHRAANGGWGADNFLQRDWTFDSQLGSLDTDLVMVWIGQNDQGYNRATYAAKINQLVDRTEAAVPDAEIVLIGTYDQGSGALAGLVDAMQDVATDRGVGFINLYEAAGNRAFFDAHGYLDDGIHFSEAGGAYVGQLLFDAFQTNGTSLVPEPTGATAVLAVASLLAVRRRRLVRLAGDERLCTEAGVG